MTPLPTVFPTDAFSVLISRLRGGAVSNGVAVTAIWNVLGYAASQLVPAQVSTDLPEGAMSVEADEEDILDGSEVDHEAVANSLQAYVDANDGKQAMLAALPWQVLLPVLFDLAKTVFAKYASGK
jgi:hypothetical protein